MRPHPPTPSSPGFPRLLSQEKFKGSLKSCSVHRRGLACCADSASLGRSFVSPGRAGENQRNNRSVASVLGPRQSGQHVLAEKLLEEKDPMGWVKATLVSRSLMILLPGPFKGSRNNSVIASGTRGWDPGTEHHSLQEVSFSETRIHLLHAEFANYTTCSKIGVAPPEPVQGGLPVGQAAGKRRCCSHPSAKNGIHTSALCPAQDRTLVVTWGPVGGVGSCLTVPFLEFSSLTAVSVLQQ